MTNALACVQLIDDSLNNFLPALESSYRTTRASGHLSTELPWRCFCLWWLVFCKQWRRSPTTLQLSSLACHLGIFVFASINWKQDRFNVHQLHAVFNQSIESSVILFSNLKMIFKYVCFFRLIFIIRWWLVAIWGDTRMMIGTMRLCISDYW